MTASSLYAPDPRRGDWGLTFTGKQFFPADPRIDDICIEDIAHALAYQCRWGGMVREHFSVAQHSVLVSQACSRPNRLVGLLHDATEAYLQDIIRPLKRQLVGYREMENAWAGAIGLVFGLGDRLVDLPKEVHDADRAVMVAERRDLMPAFQWDTWSFVEHIKPWPAYIAEGVFLDTFKLYEAGR